jgi:hypothetical protein
MQSSKLKIIFRLLCFMLVISPIPALLSAPDKTRPYTQCLIYFENTPNQLNVYRLYGRIDGNTVFILGGIQGDEPGGFMSADLYPNLVLERGNLIIIPRANFHSIIKNNRGVNGDMNRRFDNQQSNDIDDQIVEIIKSLMAESDLFLNLHDGYGFYSDTYISQNRNPSRFGQSIIADAAEYVTDKDTIQLKALALKVLAKVNQKISDPDHHLHFMNTNTFDPQTKFPEMKKSATYFALTQFGIPAFGIETSKDLNELELKIRYHNYAINEFLELFKVEPEHPAIIYEPPRLIYLLISFNNTQPIVAEDQNTIPIFKGDLVKITHIESNYNRGLSCDILGIGSDQDFQKGFIVSQPTKIIVRKDNREIGEVVLNIEEIDAKLFTYLIEVNDERRAFVDGETVRVKHTSQIKILNALHEKLSPDSYKVNLKGYVPPGEINTGEDRNYLIDVGSLQWKKYSLHNEGKIYPIVVVKNDREISRIYLAIE